MPYTKIKKILDKENISYQEIQHPAVRTCEESESYRKAQNLTGKGSKNVLMKASKSGRIFLVVTMNDINIHKRMLKPVMGEKDFRFMDAETLMETMGVAPGCVYPFGHNSEILTLVDEEIFTHEYFIFNPADPEKSIQIATKDLKKIYDTYYPEVLYFSSAI